MGEEEPGKCESLTCKPSLTTDRTLDSRYPDLGGCLAVREGDSDVSSTSLDGGQRKRKADDSDRAPLRALPARVGRGE